MRPGFVQRRTLHWQAQKEDRRTVTKEMIEQLRETGMNWRSIATSYMPWNLRANTTQTWDRVRGGEQFHRCHDIATFWQTYGIDYDGPLY